VSHLEHIVCLGNAGVEYMNRSLGGGMLPTSLGFWISGRRKEWATFLRDDLKDVLHGNFLLSRRGDRGSRPTAFYTRLDLLSTQATRSRSGEFESVAKPLYKCEEQTSWPTTDPTLAAGP
jgi:hypothetical protein